MQSCSVVDVWLPQKPRFARLSRDFAHHGEARLTSGRNVLGWLPSIWAPTAFTDSSSKGAITMMTQERSLRYTLRFLLGAIAMIATALCASLLPSSTARAGSDDCWDLEVFGCCAVVMIPCDPSKDCDPICCAEIVRSLEADIELITYPHATGKCDDYTYGSETVNGCHYRLSSCMEDFGSPNPGTFHCVLSPVTTTSPCANESWKGGSPCGAAHTCP
jgi:hypothetical protein